MNYIETKSTSLLLSRRAIAGRDEIETERVRVQREKSQEREVSKSKRNKRGEHMWAGVYILKGSFTPACNLVPMEV